MNAGHYLFSIYLSLNNGHSNFMARVTTLKILLPDTTYVLHFSNQDNLIDSIGKSREFFSFPEKPGNSQDQSPYIGKNIKKLKMYCEVLFTSKTDGHTEIKEHEFDFIRKDEINIVTPLMR
jgi:hypothetical protein